MFDSFPEKEAKMIREDVKKEIINEKYSSFEDRFCDKNEALLFISELDWGLDDILYELAQYDKKYNTDYAKINNIVDLCNAYYFILCEKVEKETK